MVKIAIVGAGVSGLAAAKHCLDLGLAPVLFEQLPYVGGTWNYTDDQSEDAISSMYQGLKTNAPKEGMVLPGLDYPANIQDSYIAYEHVLEYLQAYNRKFDLDKYVKFHHKVTKIEPLSESGESTKWALESVNIKTKDTFADTFDAVIVANGHHQKTFIPDLPGFDSFPGEHSHSHIYRRPEEFAGKRVLLVGAGPSGADISVQISKVAKKVILSYTPESNFTNIPDAVVSKPRVQMFAGRKVWFSDGTTEEVDHVMFCTGYIYDLPFLDKRCGVQVVGNTTVQPLYKHIINIQHPTMAFLGLNVKLLPFLVSEIQARFFLASITGHFQLPAKEEMFREYEQSLKKHFESGEPLGRYHFLSYKQGEYIDDLAATANIKRIPPVLHAIYVHIMDKGRNPKDHFRIVDDNTFIEVSSKEKH